MTTRQQVVLVNRSSKAISFAKLKSVAKALQTQVDRDLGPAWGVKARITPMAKGASIPKNAWPIRIVNQPVGGLGIHLDSGGKPYAQVKDTADWSVTASHELLEMLVDPLGNRFANAKDIAPGTKGRRVNYLVEVGDPCETFGYKIGGVVVSDFILPDYYDTAHQGAKVDFLGKLAGPLAVPPGGYISWIDPTDGRWHQKTPAGIFTRSTVKADARKNPRDDRDKKLPEKGDEDRHDLARIRGMMMGK